MDDITTCLITNLPFSKYKKCEDKTHRHKPYMYYSVIVENKEYTFGFCLKCFEATKKYIDENKTILQSFLLNGKSMPKETDEWDHSENHPFLLHAKDFEKFIKEQTYPIFPTEKLDNLFIKFALLSSHAGEKVIISKDMSKPTFPLKFYFKNSEELIFYINTLHANDLISVQYLNSTPISYRLTYKGLLRSIQLQEEGINSNRCFVAMSFDKSDEYIFDEAIEPVCIAFNYNAIRVDRINPNAEQTINDLIIAELKKSKFIIADFTKQKDGVYFEAGYGLGRGKKVIYTCHKSDFEKLHFDINHFPVLIYETTEQLKEMLKNKIEAYILD